MTWYKHSVIDGNDHVQLVNPTEHVCKLLCYPAKDTQLGVLTENLLCQTILLCI